MPRELFIKYLQNQCTPQEVEQLLQYFNVPDNEAVLRQLVQEALDQEVTGNMDPALEEVYANIEARIHRPSGPVIRRRFLWAAAAAAVIIAVVAWYLLQQQASTHALPAMRQLATTKGQHLQQKLPDGTMIWLAPGSTLQYPASFTAQLREVTLQGEAFFDVAHDSTHPFIVHTANTQTRVLGTSFTIQAYNDQPAVTVTLVTGKVNISTTGNREQLQLTPNQRAVFDKSTQHLVKEEAPDAAQMIARRDGLLSYKGSALITVMNDLQLRYNITIDLPTAMRSCTYYGQLNTHQALSQVLQQIALTYNATIQQHNNRWEITNGGCQH